MLPEHFLPESSTNASLLAWDEVPRGRTGRTDGLRWPRKAGGVVFRSPSGSGLDAGAAACEPTDRSMAALLATEGSSAASCSDARGISGCCTSCVAAPSLQRGLRYGAALPLISRTF